MHIKVVSYQVFKVLIVQGVGLVSNCDWLPDSDNMITTPLIGQNDTPGGLIGSQCQLSDPLVPALAIQLEAVTASQVEDTEASSTESHKDSKDVAMPTSKPKHSLNTL